MNNKARKTENRILNWFEDEKFENVDLDVSTNERLESSYDFDVERRLIFTPSKLSQMKVEIWITNDGLVSMGFDDMGRLTKRAFGYQTSCTEFVVGFEPKLLTTNELLGALSIASTGGITIRLLKVRILGVKFRKIEYNDPYGELFDRLIEFQPGSEFLAIVPNSFCTVVSYKPWD